MRIQAALPSLLLLPLLALSAGAQVPEAGFTLTADAPQTFPAEGTVPVAFQVTLGCQEVLESTGEADVEVGLGAAPAWLVAQNVTVHAGFEDCAGHGSVEVNGTLDVTLVDAPGLEPFSLELVAVKGGHDATATLEDRVVAYAPGHAMTPDGDQVFDVDGVTFEFDLVLNVTANADTMVMFEDKVVSGAAILTGLKARIFDVTGGEREAVHRITFQAPEGAWTQETVTFYTYSHCLDGPDCGPTNEQNVTWTFRNAAPSPEPVVEADVDGKDAPGPAVPLLGVALVAAAVVVRTRR